MKLAGKAKVFIGDTYIGEAMEISIESEMPKISLKQTALAFICRVLAGDRHEERATNLLPEKYRIKGLRLALYKYFSRLRYKEGTRLAKKFHTHTFRPFEVKDVFHILKNRSTRISGARFIETKKIEGAPVCQCGQSHKEHMTAEGTVRHAIFIAKEAGISITDIKP